MEVELAKINPPLVIKEEFQKNGCITLKGDKVEYKEDIN